jgi:hypothetical protein
MRVIEENACPGLDPGWVPVSRLREAPARFHRMEECVGGRRQARSRATKESIPLRKVVRHCNGSTGILAGRD